MFCRYILYPAMFNFIHFNSIPCMIFGCIFFILTFEIEMFDSYMVDSSVKLVFVNFSTTIFCFYWHDNWVVDKYFVAFYFSYDSFKLKIIFFRLPLLSATSVFYLIHFQIIDPLLCAGAEKNDLVTF